MEKSELEKKLKEVMSEGFEVPKERIKADSKLKNDLHIDSLDIIDVIVLVEQEFGIRLKNVDFKGVDTWTKFVDLVNSRL